MTQPCSSRVGTISPFIAMEVLDRAQALQRAGRDVAFLCVGEPDLPEHPAVTEAGIRAIRDRRTGYTHSLGIVELRESIAAHYERRYGVSISPERVIVSSGTSPLMLLLFTMLVERGRRVILTNPGYSCYPNFIRFCEAEPACFDLSPVRDSYDGITSLADGRTACCIVNSPANPTGLVMTVDEMRAVAALPCPVISDEIYHGLCYEGDEHSMLEFRDNAVVINGFSKAYSMTGWRLGYAVVPESIMPCVKAMHQNFVICAPSFVQWAGIAALAHHDEIVASAVSTYSKRRDVLLDGLDRLGIGYWGRPKGAFYVLADLRHLGLGSFDLCMKLLDEQGVALTPGSDFGSQAEGFVRISYAASLETIGKALERLGAFVAARR